MMTMLIQIRETGSSEPWVFKFFLIYFSILGIIGGVVAGVVIVTILILVIIVIRRRYV